MRPTQACTVITTSTDEEIYFGYNEDRTIQQFDQETYIKFKKEKVICPVIAQEGRLYAINIPAACWIPVNTLKELEYVTMAFQKKR